MEQNVYFIEDMDTHLWYKDYLVMNPNGFEMNQPEPYFSKPEYWTNNPHEAMKFIFHDMAVDFLNQGLERVGMGGKYTKNYQFTDENQRVRQLEVTEHQFIDQKNAL